MTLPTFLSSLFTDHKPDTTAARQAGKDHGRAYATDYLAGASEGIAEVMTEHKRIFLGLPSVEIIDVEHTKKIAPARKKR